MKPLKRLLAAAGIVVILLVTAALGLLVRGGALRAITPHFDGRCALLPLPGSAEDIAVDRERGFAYLSVLDRRAVIRGEDVQGTVLRIDLKARPFGPAPALGDAPPALRPHGLSLYIGPDGARRLFVSNHGARRGVDPEAVEIFAEEAPGTFAHVETIRGPELLSPNDLVATGPRQFYVANDKAAGGALAAALQQLGRGASPLSYFDGPAGRYVLDDIASGGGINAAADGRTLYVAETAGKRVRVLERRGDDGAVTELMRIPVDTSPDNIDVAADGSLWVAGHANTLALIMHFVRGAPAPTQVWRLAFGPEAVDEEEVYLDDGRQMSAGSVGATYGNLLLIGSITEPGVLVCERSG